MADKTIPLCKDCKHFGTSIDSCKRPVPLSEPDFVRGVETEPLHASPQRERRKRGFFEFGNPRCGPEGRFFEAIKKPPTAEEQLKGFKALSGGFLEGRISGMLPE